MTQPIASVLVKGIEFSVLGVEVNKTLACPDRCSYSENSSCEHRNKSMRNPQKGSLVCSLIKVNVKNFTDKAFEIYHGFGYPKIIDYKGFSFDAIYFCDACEEFLPNDFISTSTSYNLIPKSQINTVFAFQS